MKTSGSFTVLFALLLVMTTVSVYGEQSPPGGMNQGPQNRQSGGTDFDPRNISHFGLPQEAYRACEGKTVGSTAQFVAPNGETVTGTCKMADERLVLRPDHPRKNFGEMRRFPPPEAYKACEGKSAGSSAQFVNQRGETVKGMCEDEDGKLLLRPDNLRGDRMGRPHGPSQEKPKY